MWIIWKKRGGERDICTSLYRKYIFLYKLLLDTPNFFHSHFSIKIMFIKNLSLVNFLRKTTNLRSMWNLYDYQEREGIKRILVSCLTKKKKNCSYSSKAAKLESRYGHCKAWHSSLKFEKIPLLF